MKIQINNQSIIFKMASQYIELISRLQLSDVSFTFQLLDERKARSERIFQVTSNDNQ